MVDDLCLQNLVSCVVNEKYYSHCRLCLGEAGEKYIRFEDCLPMDEENSSFKSLSFILSTLFGEEVSFLGIFA